MESCIVTSVDQARQPVASISNGHPPLQIEIALMETRAPVVG